MKLTNMFRVIRGRVTLLAVDEAGMSTVEYSIVKYYNQERRHRGVGPGPKRVRPARRPASNPVLVLYLSQQHPFPEGPPSRRSPASSCRCASGCRT
jgi:hypothetical protein